MPSQRAETHEGDDDEGNDDNVNVNDAPIEHKTRNVQRTASDQLSLRTRMRKEFRAASKSTRPDGISDGREYQVHGREHEQVLEFECQQCQTRK